MLNTIFTHRSIRKFTAESVEKTVLDDVLKAGIRAATTGNMQVYSIVVTKDPQIKQKLWEAHFRQNMVLQAPVVFKPF